jgi:hypothetical protein
MRIPSLVVTLLATAALGACAHYPVFGRPGSPRGLEPDPSPKSADNPAARWPKPHSDTPSTAEPPDGPRPHPHFPGRGASPHVPMN